MYSVQEIFQHNFQCKKVRTMLNKICAIWFLLNKCKSLVIIAVFINFHSSELHFVYLSSVMKAIIRNLIYKTCCYISDINITGSKVAENFTKNQHYSYMVLFSLVYSSFIPFRQMR
jgi:hypothetical protein